MLKLMLVPGLQGNTADHKKDKLNTLVSTFGGDNVRAWL
jgi:hypothetical protein